MIASGWWCSNDVNDRSESFGSGAQRKSEFHSLWHESISTFTNPEQIVIIDSASPILPELKTKETWISLTTNFGHSTKHIDRLCGVSRSFVLSLMYCLMNDYDYWVYVEQDCLLFGDGIVENEIGKDKKGLLFGSGSGTPQPVQHSFMIIRKDKILSFVGSYLKIKAPDRSISPEVKFAIAASIWLKYIPELYFVWMEKRQGFIAKLMRKLFWKLYMVSPGYQKISIGYGRDRPINFNDKWFYFQHGSDSELQAYLAKVKTT